MRPVPVLLEQLGNSSVPDNAFFLGSDPSQNDNAGAYAGSTVPMSPWAVLIAAALLLVNGALSLRFRLGLHRALLVAALRYPL